MVKTSQVHSGPDQGRTVVDGLNPTSDRCFHQFSQGQDLKVSSSVASEHAIHGITKCGAFKKYNYNYMFYFVAIVDIHLCSSFLIRTLA